MNFPSEFTSLVEKGFLVSHQAIDPTLVNQLHDYLVVRLDCLHEQFREWSGGEDVTSVENYRKHSNKIAEYESKGLPKNLRHFLRGEFDLETRLSSEIRQFMSISSLREKVATALGEEKYFLHYPPMVRFKVPNADQTIVPPHQDSAYSSHIEKFITVWVPLTPITEEVGGVAFYEGTQHLGQLPHGASGAWESRALFDESIYSKSSPQMELGDILFFTPTIVHASETNISKDTIRFSIDMRAFSQTTVSPKPYYDPWTKEIYNN
ncbi:MULTISPECIES: phytanoyl-CoA dioxygenase family protein [unclassified Microcoleus]|uniref:phytanoyl-CoA dioxygenase family protein n=1 Tax=unclassified Microcoleus TaxID=2642155 RepID=UPI002FD344A5